MGAASEWLNMVDLQLCFVGLGKHLAFSRGTNYIMRCSLCAFGCGAVCLVNS